MSQYFRPTKSVPDRMLAARIEQLRQELDQTRAEQQRLRSTLRDIARESDVSVGGVCCECDEAYVVVKDSTLSCPSCSNRAAV